MRSNTARRLEIQSRQIPIIVVSKILKKNKVIDDILRAPLLTLQHPQPIRHAPAGGDPEIPRKAWIPAFAGMTTQEMIPASLFPKSRT